jgi:hypothetical protein
MKVNAEGKKGKKGWGLRIADLLSSRILLLLRRFLHKTTHSLSIRNPYFLLRNFLTLF